MRVGIIGGSGVYAIKGLELEPHTIVTPYGRAQVFFGKKDDLEIVFLTRHGSDHRIPPHRINHRANIKAMQLLGVQRILATFSVGSLQLDIPPQSLVALDQFIDFAANPEITFYEGGSSGLVHTEMTEPYCVALREQTLALASKHELRIRPKGTYVGVRGPRFETAAEISLYAQLGGDVVGMTGVPEAVLARELGIHYAAVALSVNWGAGLHGPIKIEREGLERIRTTALSLFIDALQVPLLGSCGCETARLVIHPPEEKTSTN